MYYRRRASPKHGNNMTEVEYGGGGHRTRLRNDHEDQLVCLGGPPAPVYKGARGRPAGLGGAPREGGVLLPVGVGLPFPSPTRFGEGKEKRGRGRRKGGPRPPPPSPIWTPHGGGARHLLARPSLSPRGPLWPITSPGFPVTPSGTPVLSETTRNHSDVRT